MMVGGMFAMAMVLVTAVAMVVELVGEVMVEATAVVVMVVAVMAVGRG